MFFIRDLSWVFRVFEQATRRLRDGANDECSILHRMNGASGCPVDAARFRARV